MEKGSLLAERPKPLRKRKQKRRLPTTKKTTKKKKKAAEEKAAKKQPRRRRRKGTIQRIRVSFRVKQRNLRGNANGK
ncbi:MAG: hypothetical protein R3C03_14195 [Pirellulaceae bacterium]